MAADIVERLCAFPLTLREANDVVDRLHRHHKPVRFHLFSLGALFGDRMCGAVIVMRPVNQSRAFEGLMVEVSRLATDGTRNAPSFLLGRAAKIAFAMGYMGVQTYTLPEEGGASLRAVGWSPDGLTKGTPWSTARRQRNDQHPLGPKQRWICVRPDIVKSALKEHQQ